MATHYDRLPTLEERVRASKLIVTGRVESIKPLTRTRIGEIEEEQAIARVTISKPLRGLLAAREIDVRFVSSRRDGKCDESHPFRVAQRLVLLLVPDIGRGIHPNTYVAYFRGAYPLTTNDTFMIETESEPPKRYRRKLRVSLSRLREIVKTIEAEETAETRAWAKMEPQLAKRPGLPPVTEIPDIEPGAGPTSAEPTAAATSRPERKK